MTALLIVNPAAGGGRTERLWPGLRDELHRLGFAFEWTATGGPGRATDLARDAAEAPPGEGRELVARVHPDVAAWVEREGRADLERLEAGLQVKITLQPASAASPREEYEIRVR